MESFTEIGPHVFPKSGTQTHRRTDAATLYRNTLRGKNGLHAFGNNSVESEAIWMKSGTV